MEPITGIRERLVGCVGGGTRHGLDRFRHRETEGRCLRGEQWCLRGEQGLSQRWRDGLRAPSYEYTPNYDVLTLKQLLAAPSSQKVKVSSRTQTAAPTQAAAAD